MIGGFTRHLRGLTGLAGDVRDRRFGERLAEIDQLRRPGAVNKPIELPRRDKLDRE